MGVGVGVGDGDLSGFGFGDGEGVVDGSGIVALGFGVAGVGVGEGVIVTVGDGEARRGAVNGVAGRSTRARSMNRRHIWAGKDAPTTAMPRTLFIALNEPAYPFQTTAVSSGVYPANHASR